MERWEIKPLIDKYYQGNTNLTEEKQLRTYFSEVEDIPEEWMACRTMLLYFESQENQKAPAVEVNMQSGKQKRFKSMKWSVAAVGLVLIASGILYLNKPFSQPDAAENSLTNSKIEDTEILFQELKKAVEEGKENLNVSKRISSLD